MFDRSEERPSEDLAWAAGLFDGEGSTLSTGPWDTPQVVVPQSGPEDAAPEVLTRFHHVFALGSINGPHMSSRQAEKPKWRYVASGPRALTVLDRLWPFLGAVKRQQAEAVIARYRSHPTPHAEIAALTGRPLRIRSQCRKGHPLHDGYSHRGKLHCRTCRRMNDRARRARLEN